MGIFGAMTTAVAGLRAQSFALENISGNIANSQTTAFKRIDTAFQDLIPDLPPSKQLAGSVIATSRATNSVQGDIQNASIGTFMAINGDGFYVVQKPSNFVASQPVFSGSELYTRRGDFQTDKNGYLVNGAGYYLMGIPVDPTTGNLVGSVPTLLQFQNNFIPAQATNQIEYRANLASYPLTPTADPTVPQSELLNPAAFQANPVAGPPQPARITGFGASILPDAPAVATGTTVLPGALVNTGNVTINGTVVNLLAGQTPAQVVTAINTAAPPGVTASLNGLGNLVLTSANADTNIAITAGTPAVLTEIGVAIGTTNATNLLTQSAASAGQTLTVTVGVNPTLTITFGTGGAQVSTLAELNAALATLVGGTASANAANGNTTIIAGNMTDQIVVGGTATASNFGIQTLLALPANGTVVGNDLTTFVNQSIGGGAVTAYDIAGAPVNIQLRWAKIQSSAYGGTDTWNLFYQENSAATGTQVAWRNAGINYTFAPNGQMSPLVATLTLNNMTVNGVNMGNVQMVHGPGGITQFSDPNGTVKVNLLQQNGYPAGNLQSIAVSDKGRIVGSYSNGRTIDLAEITLAEFNGPDKLKRLDGGAFESTDESGLPIYGASGRIVASSLEGSNTDIADEFTKLIVTQQAYSANTRIITTSNQMVQDLLNMIR